MIVSAISPYRETREQVRRRIIDFVGAYVDAPIEDCAERDVKGLYEKAFAGEIENFTGVSDPYDEPPVDPLVIKTAEEEPLDSALKVLEKPEIFGYAKPAAEVEEFTGVLDG